DACSRCGLPMMDRSDLQLGHPDAGNGFQYLLEHGRSCNMSAGGTAGGKARSRPGDRDRVCPICHASFHATDSDQVACSREHAFAVRRGDAPWPESGRAW
ncbi:MAG: hypothetical protein M3Y33_11870, partial [Actinomycetota bacterium]|nr:hypothetical protein [Actinomycetota bacterium]